MERFRRPAGFLLCFRGVISSLRNVLPSTFLRLKTRKVGALRDCGGRPLKGKCIKRPGSFDWILENLRHLGGFAVCERDCYCAVFCCHVRVQFLLEKRLDYLEKPAGNKKAYAPVLVDALAFEVTFL